MKPLTITFIFLFALCANAQTCDTVEVCQSQLSEASRMINKLLDINQANTDALKSKTGEVEALQKLVKTLEDSQRTPCTIAMTQVKTDLIFWFGQLSADGTSKKDKKVMKVIDKTLKRGEKAINQQCGTQSGSIWKTLWEGVKVAVPIAAAVLIANE